MSVKDRVQELLEEHEELLSDVPWASERERWHELLFSVLLQTAPDARSASTALAILAALRLTEPEAVAAFDTAEHRTLVDQILRRVGFAEETVSMTLNQLAGVGRVVQSQMGGKIQRFLRAHGEQMREELVGQLAAQGLDTTAASAAVTHWLQTVLTMPVSMRHDSLLEFSVDAGGCVDDAIGVADELDLSVAALDHLVAASRVYRRAQ